MGVAILGLDINDYNTSAALVVDGRIRAAAQEERFRREKRTRRFPSEAMRFCLQRAGLSLGDLTAVAVSVNPAIYLEGLNPSQSERARFRGELLYAPINYLLGAIRDADARSVQVHVEEARTGHLDVCYVTHHDAHAATAFYLSPFDSASVLSLDGFGEKETTVYYAAQGTRIDRLQNVEFPNSVGCFYAAITEFLGLEPFHHEWKVMGAAAHGDPSRYIDAMRSLIRCTGGGRFEVALQYFNYYQFHRPGSFSPRLSELLGPPFPSPGDPDRRFYDIAAAAQQVTEEVVLDLLRHLADRSPSPNVCLTGGVAMNCVLNGKVAANTPFDHVFVPPMPDDSGTSIGAALHACHGAYRQPRGAPMLHNYLGPEFSDPEIETELNRCGIAWRRLDDPGATAAQGIADGALVGWFQGAMEFGDRALGNRSILADPRRADVPQRINDRIKDREAFQPFAPSCLAERVSEYFVDAGPSPFMEKAFASVPERRASILAVLNADGTARVQTVTREQNPAYYRLIQEFARLTGIPMVLNTSFNLRNEPIVCTPRDAIRTFYSSGLDQLFLGSYGIWK